MLQIVLDQWHQPELLRTLLFLGLDVVPVGEGQNGVAGKEFHLPDVEPGDAKALLLSLRELILTLCNMAEICEASEQTLRMRCSLARLVM